MEVLLRDLPVAECGVSSLNQLSIDMIELCLTNGKCMVVVNYRHYPRLAPSGASNKIAQNMAKLHTN